jgi:ActR/RegA family two-component response regulator
MKPEQPNSKILLIDDRDTYGPTLAFALNSLGFETEIIETFFDAMAVLPQLRERGFGAVLIRLNFSNNPGLGAQVVRQIKNKYGDEIKTVGTSLDEENAIPEADVPWLDPYLESFSETMENL